MKTVIYILFLSALLAGEMSAQNLVGAVSLQQGDTLLYRGNDEPRVLSDSEDIYVGDQLSLSPEARAWLELPELGRIRLMPGTHLTVDSLSPDDQGRQRLGLTLKEGMITGTVLRSGGIGVRTSLGTVGALAGDFSLSKQIFINTGIEKLDVSNLDGEVEITSNIAPLGDIRAASFIRRDCDYTLNQATHRILSGQTVSIYSSRDTNCMVFPVITPAEGDLVVVSPELPSLASN